MRISDAEMARLLSEPEHLLERAWQWSDAEVDMRPGAIRWLRL